MSVLKVKSKKFKFPYKDTRKKLKKKLIKAIEKKIKNLPEDKIGMFLNIIDEKDFHNLSCVILSDYEYELLKDKEI